MATSLEITLPSRGLLYKEPGIPEGKVTIRTLLIDELALFEGNGDAWTRMSEVIKQSTNLPRGFDQGDLLSGDRFALLIALRNHSLPVKYPIKFKCVACGHLNTYKFDPATELRVKSVAPGTTLVEPFEVELPDLKKTLKMRFTRAKDQESTMKYVRSVTAKTGDLRNLGIKHGHAKCLVEIDGQPAGDMLQREQFLTNLSMYDALVLQKKIDSLEPGIDTEINPECSNCQHINTQEMPFTPEFFRPTDL